MFIDVKLSRGRLDPWGNLVAILDLAKALRNVGADLLHNYTIQSIFIGTMAGRLAGVRFFVNSFTGLGSILGHKSKAPIFQRLLTAALRLVMSRLKVRVIAQNATDCRQLISLRLRPASQVVVVRGSGINLDKFPGRTSIERNCTTVVCLARLIKDKGIQEYVRAANLVTAINPHVKFMLAGSEDPRNPNSISAPLLDKWKRDSLVEFLGHVDDPRSVFDQSDIFVLPSYREGLPRTILEAFAMELPVIACDVPGCRDIVEHGVNGLLIPPRNAEALAHAILELVESPARCRTGISGKKLVTNKYSNATHASEVKSSLFRIVKQGIRFLS